VDLGEVAERWELQGVDKLPERDLKVWREVSERRSERAS
jgi:hypothetical protein